MIARKMLRLLRVRMRGVVPGVRFFLAGALLLALLPTLAAAGLVLPGVAPAVRHIDWYYTVPDRYEGLLYIYWECEGGGKLVVREGRAHIRFPRDGIVCFKDKFTSSRGLAYAQFEDGTHLPTAASRRACDDAQGAVLCQLGTGRDADRNNGNMYDRFRLQYNE